MKQKGLTIYGSFGFGNAGDEAVPEAVRDMLGELGLKHRVDVVTRFDNAVLDGVIGMGSRDAARRDALRAGPLLISGGGIIEPFANSGLFRAEPMIRAAPKGRAVVFAASVEPGVAFGLRPRWDLARLLPRLRSTVYTRDRLSERTLKQLVPWARTETVGDLVLWMRPQRTPKLEALALPGRYVACILAPRWSRNTAWTEWIVDELAAAARNLKASVVFVPMSALHDDDRPEHARIAQRMAERCPDVNTHEVRDVLAPREVCELIARSVFTVSMRLHGCVMACAQRVPFVCIAYHPKLLGFSETVGCLDSALPFAKPARQSTGAYGYDFASLKLKPGDLSRAMDAAIRHKTDPHVEELKRKSLHVFGQMLRED